MSSYTGQFRKLLEKNRDAENAVQMKQYMRNQYDFFGIKAPERKNLLRQFIRDNGYPGDLKTIVREWWEEPERELQHCALELLDRKKKSVGEDFITTYEWIILNKSWWDTVDFIAANLVGYHFKTYPHLIPDYMKRWMESDNIWLQRTCLLFQLKYKEQTDWNLLQSLIYQLNESNEFFIRKAIGWALRQYSKFYPELVVRFVEQTNLSGLSKTEALKVINRNKQ